MTREKGSRTGRCQGCNHLERVRIERLLAAGASIKAAARKFAIDYHALRRHWRNHVSAEARAAYLAGAGASKDQLEAIVADESLALIDHYRIVRGALYKGLSAASELGDGNAVGLLAGRLHENFRDCGRLTGELQHGPLLNIQNNVLITADYTRAIARIVGAVAPYPEAREAVVAALRDLDAASPSPPAPIDRGALWTRALLEELRWPAGKRVPDLSRVVVAVDPAVTSGEEADETGLIVAGRDYDGRGYVLDDRTGRYAPIEWAREAVMLYRKYDADRVVAEVNNGGDMVEATLRMVDENVSFNAVRASRGKIVRHHIGFFPVLEDQMTSFTSDLDRQSAGYSPDRVDALVWAFTELLVAPMPSYAAYEIARERAEAVIAQRRAEEEARRPKLTPAKGSVEYMELLKSLNTPR